MFSLSCWRALSDVSLPKFLPYCQYILAYTEFSLPESSSATSSCLVILLTWSPNESLSWNLCPIFKNKYNTNKRNLDCSHQPWPTRRCDCGWVNSYKISRLQFQRGPRHPGYSENTTRRNGRCWWIARAKTWPIKWSKHKQDGLQEDQGRSPDVPRVMPSDLLWEQGHSSSLCLGAGSTGTLSTGWHKASQTIPWARLRPPARQLQAAFAFFSMGLGGGSCRGLHGSRSMAESGCSIALSSAVQGAGVRDCFFGPQAKWSFPDFLPQPSASKGISSVWPEHVKFCTFGHLCCHALRQLPLGQGLL